MFILTSISIMQQVQKNFNCILFSNHAHITMTKIMGKWQIDIELGTNVHNAFKDLEFEKENLLKKG